MTTFSIYFNSGQGSENKYSNGDNVSLIEITKSDQDYYQNGIIKLYDIPSSQTVGDTCMVIVDGVVQFNGYVAGASKYIDGAAVNQYQLVGKTYDLWRYVTDGDAIYSGNTAAIASSLVATYCTGINTTYITPTDGISLTNEVDFKYQSVGDAIASLIELDGYKFYVDEEDNLQYYYQDSDPTHYDFIITESDILDMSPIEQSDADLINDCLVIGGSDYSSKTTVGDVDEKSEEMFPSGLYVAQSFNASDIRLNAIKTYFGRTTDPLDPDTINFEIWENTSNEIFNMPFSDYDGIDLDNSYNIKVKDGKLQLSGQLTDWGQYAQENQDVAKFVGIMFRPSMNGMIERLNMKYYLGGENGQTVSYKLKNATNNTVGSGKPGNTTYRSGSQAFYWAGTHSNLNWDIDPPFYMESGTQYCLWIADPNYVYFKTTYFGNNPNVYSWLSNDDSSWNAGEHPYVIIYYVSGSYPTSGLAMTDSYGNATQYIKTTLDGTVSSSKIYLSGSQDGGSTWKTINDDQWYNFGSEDETGTKVKFILSSNGYYTPKIDSASAIVSDSTGGVDEEVFEDTFDDYTYLSSNNMKNMKVLDGKLQLSGSMTSNEGNAMYTFPDDAEVTYQQDNFNVGGTEDNALEDDGYCYFSDAENDIMDIVYTFNTPQFIDKVLFDTWQWVTRYMYHSYTWISGSWTAGGWLEVGNHGYNHTVFDSARTKVHNYRYYDISDCGYVYSGVRKIKIRYYAQGLDPEATWFRLYRLKFRTYDWFKVSGAISSNNYTLGSNVDLTSLYLEPESTEIWNNIKYSGSLDAGLHKYQLFSNIWTSMGTAGKNALLVYYFRPSGSWPAGKASSSTMLPKTPTLESSKLTASLVFGGGIPASGTKLEWSDDISWTTSDFPYAPSWSAWNSYTDPKLQLTEDDTYWMIFKPPGPSGNEEKLLLEGDFGTGSSPSYDEWSESGSNIAAGADSFILDGNGEDEWVRASTTRVSSNSIYFRVFVSGWTDAVNSSLEGYYRHGDAGSWTSFGSTTWSAGSAKGKWLGGSAPACSIGGTMQIKIVAVTNTTTVYSADIYRYDGEKYWSYYYDPTSSYDGKICYSWDNGVRWSSNSAYPSGVPPGNMCFKMGWKEGEIMARASNQSSINAYGRHFKKVNDSNINTQEVANARANAEVENSESVPYHGTLVINGRTAIDTDYRFSSNLTNIGINEIWDIVSYTQRIDERGFTTEINYGKHPYDIARRVSELQKEVES